MSLPNLYHIEQEWLRVMESINDADGEITDEQFQALQINKDNLQNKAIQFTMIIADQAGDIEKIDKEIDRLSNLKESRKKGNERLKGIITEAMKLYGVSKIEGENFKLSFRKSTSLKIVDEKLIPAGYWEKVPATLKLKNAEVKKALVDGAKIAGAELLVNEYNLQVKQLEFSKQFEQKQPNYSQKEVDYYLEILPLLRKKGFKHERDKKVRKLFRVLEPCENINNGDI